MTGWWYFVAGRLEAGARDWISARVAEGFAVSFDRLSREGFPGEAAVRFEVPSIRRSTGDESVQWRGPTLTLAVPTTNPGRLRFELGGRHVAQWLARGADLTLATEKVAGAVVPQEDGGWLCSATADEVQLTSRSNPAGAVHASQARVWARVPATPGQPLRAGGETERLELSESGPFGTLVEQASATVVLVPAPAALGAEALSAWASAGGRLEVHQLAFRWGPIAVEAKGTIGVDAQARPAGELSLRVRGFDRAVDVLVQQRRIPAENGPALKLLGRWMARGSDGAVDVPVRLEGGWLYAGPAKIAPLQPVF